MDGFHFDALTRVLGTAASRRALIPVLGGLLTALLVGASPSNAKKKKPKKTTLCLNGQTIRVSKKKKKKLLKNGATPGACCASACAGKPCSADDGCGGICGCGAGSVCQGGVCHACDVVCGGDGVTCGNILKSALTGLGGGTLYACPGRYIGNFLLGNGALVGAGNGADPATNTILDANGTGQVVHVNAGVNAALQGLRITGGSLPNSVGGGIHNQGTLTATTCTITKNRANLAAGLYTDLDATSVLNSCIVAENTADITGGGIFTERDATTTILGTAITGNKAIAGSGGGVFNEGSVTFDSASSVTGNTCSSDFPNGGGGIYNQLSGTSTVTLNGATVSGNTPDNCVNVTGC